jgi:hypothetical protein
LGRWTVHPELAAAGLWTTAAELAQVVIEMSAALAGRGRVLSAASAKEMLTRQPWGNLGLSWALTGDGDALRFDHGGSNKGFRNQIWGVPHTGQGFVVLTNSDIGGGIAPALLREIARVYDWPPLARSSWWTPERVGLIGAAVVGGGGLGALAWSQIKKKRRKK